MQMKNSIILRKITQKSDKMTAVKKKRRKSKLKQNLISILFDAGSYYKKEKDVCDENYIPYFNKRIDEVEKVLKEIVKD
jgi:hypothetical protein